jgi:DNA-binding MarR family transcriptional regulator
VPEFLDLHGQTSKALRALTEAEMRRHGLHYGQDLVLAVLWERDGRTPGEAAATLHVTTPTIVKMATRMAAAGLLTRRRDDRDNRLVRLYLTDAGKALKGPVLAARQSLEDKVTAGLTGAERERLLAMLATVYEEASQLLASSGGHADAAGELTSLDLGRRLWCHALWRGRRPAFTVTGAPGWACRARLAGQRPSVRAPGTRSGRTEHDGVRAGPQGRRAVQRRAEANVHRQRDAGRAARRR